MCAYACVYVYVLCVGGVCSSVLGWGPRPLVFLARYLAGRRSGAHLRRADSLAAAIHDHILQAKRFIVHATRK